MQVLNPNPYVPQDQQFIPKQSEIEERCKWFALNSWLSDYPEHLSYEEILDLLDQDEWNDPHRDDDDGCNQIVEWYLIEGHSGDQVADFIRDTYVSALRLVKGLING
jgi:hypothetical protein